MNPQILQKKYVVPHPLRFVVSYVIPVTYHYEARTAQKAPLQSTYTTSKKINEHTPVISIKIWKIKYPLRFVLSYVQPLTQQYNQELFKKHHYNQSSHYENADNFRYEGKPSHATAQSTLLCCQQR